MEPAAPVSVHPRLRGEYLTASRLLRSCIGSSPPARGILVELRPQRLNLRFIPACAGNTAARATTSRQIPVHPRLRGEYFTAGSIRTSSFGSSPPARGIQSVANVLPISNRFIPACAGNTHVRYGSDLPQTGSSPPARGIRRESKCRTQAPAVHPRLRGEYHEVNMADDSVDGSSPPARGIHPPAPTWMHK